MPGSGDEDRLIGTGFVADYYMTTLANHRELELAGVYDCSPDRLRAFFAFHGTRPYEGLEAVLAIRRSASSST